MISLAAPEDLSTFVRDVVREMTPVSTITLEHTTQEGGHAIEQRAIISKEAFLVLDEALRGRKASATRPSAYLQAPAVARMLGIKTGTLAKWRRLGTGPNGWVRMNRTSVMYPIAEVEAFVTNRKRETSNANRHPKVQKSSSGPGWNRRTKTALFDVLAPGSKERFRRVLPFASVQEAMAAFMSFRAVVKAGHGPDDAGHRPDEAGDATEAALPEQSTFTEYVTRHLDSIWGGYGAVHATPEHVVSKH